jgi:hypothetical protein
MNVEDLKTKFIVDDDVLKTRLEPIVDKALIHCKIDKKGQVLITNSHLSARDQLCLVLSARAIAAQLDPSISADVTVPDIEKYLGLPANQVRARGNDAIKARFAESPSRGVYRAVPHKVEAFLDGIAPVDKISANKR